MVRTQIQLTEAQVRKLRRAAAAQGASVAEVIRRCIDAAVDEQMPGPAAAYSRAADLIGAFADPEPAVATRHDDFLDSVFR